MRRSARLGKKKTNSENEAEKEPKAKKSRLDGRTSNIATLDNGTMVETFKYLNYCQLATSSLVSKRFWNLILTHRHKLPLLDVGYLSIYDYIGNEDPVHFKIFNVVLSPEKYNEWIVRNGYSKQIEGQIAGKENTENDCDIYVFRADIYQNTNSDLPTNALYGHAELKDEHWPWFQHFVRLLMDPFVYIRYLVLSTQKDVLHLQPGAMKADRNRLKCQKLYLHLNDDTQNYIVWIKNYVRCEEFKIFISSDSNCDSCLIINQELLDLYLTGAACTPAINVEHYDLSKVVHDLVQKFVDLKSCDEYQLVESIEGDIKDREVVEKLKRNCAEFIAEEAELEEGSGTRQVIGLINHDIAKKLTLSVGNVSYDPSYSSIKFSNL